ncbi:hypothetical protein HPB48_021449 [Haemaphysalis longicornis]|uniref:Uncharacterized protein n=1 Tax=Haemaphysalis longicornis TaxID=44386 RepID=A0A9J6F9H7_HAELO|nr:hypothetical protein HPB48_021449 [Haemaphysalis longicornis]
MESNSKDPGFFKVPKVRTSECEKTKLLSEKRRRRVARADQPAGTMDPDKYRVGSRHFLSELQDVAANLQNELTDVKMELLASKFTKDSLKDDDQKVAFYTGLPSFLMLFSLFNLLKDHASHCSRNALTQFEKMMLFLMRLRLGLHTQDLAYR